MGWKPAWTFSIQLVEDFSPPEVPRARALLHKKRPGHDDSGSSPAPRAPDYVATETEVSDSYLSAVFSTIQPLGGGKSLLILTVTCHPAPERRFENATITWHISAPQSSSRRTSPSRPVSPSSLSRKPSTNRPKPPTIYTIAPQQSIGGWTEEQTKLIWGLKVPVTIGMKTSVSVQPSVEHDTQKDVVHAMTILGSIRNSSRQATWTIEENKSSQRGIPAHFQLAVVVDHQGPFIMELDIKALVTGGIFDSYLNASKSGNRLRKTIDVQTWKCGDVVWEPGEAGWKNYVASLTGEVPGIVVDFDQKIVRP